MTLRSLALLAFCGCQFALTGCSTPEPVLSRSEYLATTNRFYPGLSREQVIAAAEQLLRLADGNDFKIADNPTGFVATRNWTDYLVLTDEFGIDTWSVNTESSAGGTRLWVQVGTQSSVLLPTVGAGGAAYASPSAPVANPVQGTAIYDVFWARLDYLLGKRPDWMTCDVADARVDRKITWGSNAALCNSFNVKDRTPRGPMISAR